MRRSDEEPVGAFLDPARRSDDEDGCRIGLPCRDSTLCLRACTFRSRVEHAPEAGGHHPKASDAAKFKSSGLMVGLQRGAVFMF